jgi:hypothetical protein
VAHVEWLEDAIAELFGERLTAGFLDDWSKRIENCAIVKIFLARGAVGGVGENLPDVLIQRQPALFNKLHDEHGGHGLGQ